MVKNIGSYYYWVLTSIVLITFFTIQGNSLVQTFYFVSFLLPVSIGASYYFTHHLIPRYYIPKRLGSFFLYFIYAIIISLYAQYLVIFLSLFIFSAYQGGSQNILTINISSLNLSIYIIILLNVVWEILSLTYDEESSLEKKSSSALQDFITIRYNRQNHRVLLDQIYFIESLSDYVKIITPEKTIVSKETISHLAERLPPRFIRTHRSFLANRDHIGSYNKAFVSIKSYDVPISRTYKKAVLEALH